MNNTGKFIDNLVEITGFAREVIKEADHNLGRDIANITRNDVQDSEYIKKTLKSLLTSIKIGRMVK